MSEQQTYTREFVHVLAALREQITRGERVSGSVLSERILGTEFGLSRLPARQAIAALVSEGLATAPGARTPARVRGLTPDEVDDVIEVCSVLDTLALRLAAERRTSDQVVVLHQIQAEERALLERGDALAVLDKVFEFRRQIHTMSGNLLVPVLNGMIEGRFRRVLAHAPFLDLVVKAHGVLCRAMLRRDPDLAEATIRLLLEEPGRRRQMRPPGLR